MGMRKILVIGKTGQVGWELRRALAVAGEVVAVDYPEVNLADAASIRACMNGLRPDVIINAAAYTAVDRAESEPELAGRINGVAPGILAEEASRCGALMVHYSTDYVFDGSKGAPYIETDPTGPLGVYGRTKLAGEESVRHVGGDHLILRLCWVYGARGQNFLRTIRRLARERDELRVVGDQWGSPTWSRWVAEATAMAVRATWEAGRSCSLGGTYHLAAAGVTSWHGFADEIVSAMPAGERRCQRVIPITTAEYPTPARRPAYSVLAGEKLRRVFGIALPGWREGLDLVLEELT